MRPVYDEFEDFDFSDSPALGRIMREQRREERRFADRRNDWRRTEEFFEFDEFENSNVNPETSTADMPNTLIGEILNSPNDFSGRQVAIVGYYRGWDLLKEVSNGSPVTRSDWVIADESGAIYVTGVFPKGLDPSSMDSAMTMVRLSATVEYNERGIYLVAQSVEVLPRN